MDAVEVLTRLGGVAETRDLRASLPNREIRRAAKVGQILRVSQGRYTLPTMEPARLAAARVNGVVSHLDAALHWGWKVKLPPEQPMVTVPRGRKLSAVRRVESDVHHADLAAHEVIGGVTSPLRTVIDCARALPFDAALAVADSALRSGRITKSELVAAAGRAPRTGRAKVLRVAKFADPRADNPFESVLRAIAIERGLRLTPQLCCHEFIHADLGSNELRLAVEAESWSYHGDRGAFEADVRRYSLLVREAWVVIRFVWYDVMFRQDHVGEALVSVANRCAARPAVVSEHAS